MLPLFRWSAHRAALVLIATLCVAQALAAAQEANDAPLPVLHTSTQLVVVDVLVQDSKGRPVHGLTRANFRVDENKAPQTLRSFDEHTTADAPPAGPRLPPLPPGTFTNYTATPASSTLNVLLLDALNTSRNDQTYLRTQLQQYVESAPAGQTIAIFGLNSRLYLLQGFTADASTLKRAIKGKLASRGSDLLDDPTGSGLETQRSSDAMADMGPGLDLVVANLQQFEADSDAQRLQLRAQYTLDALNAMAHYLANFPGRKNLIWFSGSFPVNVLPDPSLANGFSSLQLNQDELRETTNLFTKAQVAVYPVDARGVQTEPMYDAASSGRRYAASPTNLGRDLAKFSAAQASEHATMDEVAADTGGHAYYGTNGLADAVASAIDSGSNYYTLSYSPTHSDPHGELRSIHVELVGAPATAGLQLSYRHGYYAREREAATPAIAAPNTPDPRAVAAEGYARNVLSHGSPLPQDILFQVGITPSTTNAPDHLAQGNQPGSGVPATGPFRQLSVNYAALPGDFVFAPQPDGRRLATVAFKVYVFDTDGRVLDTVSKAVRFDLPPDAYRRLMQAGVGMHLDVSVPARTHAYLRIAIEDVAANKFGAVEIPLEQIDAIERAATAAKP